jgi:hypothetical protein
VYAYVRALLAPNQAEDAYFDVNRQDRNSLLDDRFGDSDSESLIDGQPANSNNPQTQPWHHQPVQYVYDAAAERTQQRLLEAQKAYNEVHGATTPNTLNAGVGAVAPTAPLAVNGVH